MSFRGKIFKGLFRQSKVVIFYSVASQRKQIINDAIHVAHIDGQTTLEADECVRNILNATKTLSEMPAQMEQSLRIARRCSLPQISNGIIG